MTRLAGKTCVVTAAGQGIGRAIAEAFDREGAETIAVDMNQSVLEAWTSPKGIRSAVVDATDPEAVARLAREIDGVSVLANCVGVVPAGTIMDTPVDALEKSFRINVGSMHLMIENFLPQMLAQGAGSIINISSVVSSVSAAPNRYVYATTKAAIIGLTKSVALDFIARGIRCNSISPGTVDSPSLWERMAATGDAKKAHEQFVARQPMGRLGKPAEIAEIAVLLASDEAGYMSGANIVIDGGMSL